MPSIPKLPTFELPKLPFDLPTIDLSSFELPTLSTLTEALPELPELPTFEQWQAAGAKVVELVTAGVEQARAAATN